MLELIQDTLLGLNMHRRIQQVQVKRAFDDSSGMLVSCVEHANGANANSKEKCPLHLLLIMCEGFPRIHEHV